MIRKFIILVLLVAAFAVAFAPAALLRHAIPVGAQAALTALSGTLWDGQADLLLGGRNAGRLAWRLTPLTILQGKLGYHLTLSGAEQALAADLWLRRDGIEAVIDGTAQGSYFNAWLGDYDIGLAGDFAFESVNAVLPYRFDRSTEPVAAAGSAGGHLTWSGGAVRYRLSGQDFNGTLPALDARLGDGLEAVVRAADNDAPLLRAELLANGFVRLGMTRLLTRLLNNPWPGTGADHEVVLEVEERLL